MNNNDPKSAVEGDAKGQYAPSQADPKASGVASAKPTAVTHSEDATVNRDSPRKEKSDKDWDVNFDETNPDKS
ncbi:hypothetical protein ASF69_07450 [Rhizobium sp. Leaf311]|uniref:hypothetical protein n=1 Tax=Rhizobium sp. Leaf311 TaxID=1736332 RepID=UPI0007145B78|nr:hypothetical protein [Rhizobium sp. Leaf311]KQQ46026.1 hypothetical protein ASF69_07450 [Rhizobium sp. Leaf311]